MTVNKVILVGNLGADPEIRQTNSGNSVGNLRIATTERQKDRDGNWNDHTEWHSVVCFGRTAENVGRFLRKGRQVYIEGRLQTRKWTDKDGVERFTTEIIADSMQMLGGRSGGGSVGMDDDYGSSAPAPRQSAAPASRPAARPAAASNFSDMDDDIPF